MSLPKSFFPAAILVSGLALFFTGCSRNEPATANAPSRLKLGYLVKQPEEPWFQFQWKAADKAAAQYGFDLLKFGTQDGEKVMDAIDNLAVAGAKGFVICTPDVRLGPQIIARANQKGLKVIAVDDQFVRPDGSFMADVHYIGMSASQIGQSVGHALAAEMKHRNWPVAETGVCAVTFEELDTARERTDGAISALKADGFPADRIFKTAQKTTDIPGSFDAASVLLTREPAIKHWLVCGMNDNGVLGAIRATEARGFTADNVIGIGINGTDCIDELRKPKPTGFFGSMLVSAPGEGFRATEMLYQWVKDGTNPPLDTRTPGIFINRGNFEAVLKTEGIIP
jgi:L-arabinose transport system substrate-binding protein